MQAYCSLKQSNLHLQKTQENQEQDLDKPNSIHMLDINPTRYPQQPHVAPFGQLSVNSTGN